jgi:hypothetical protein
VGVELVADSIEVLTDRKREELSDGHCSLQCLARGSVLETHDRVSLPIDAFTESHAGGELPRSGDLDTIQVRLIQAHYEDASAATKWPSTRCLATPVHSYAVKACDIDWDVGDGQFIAYAICERLMSRLRGVVLRIFVTPQELQHRPPDGVVIGQGSDVRIALTNRGSLRKPPQLETGQV